MYEGCHVLGDAATSRTGAAEDALLKILAEAVATPDHAKRVALYKQAQKIILDYAPWAFINSVLQVRATRKDVRGYQLNPTQMFFDMEQVSVGG